MSKDDDLEYEEDSALEDFEQELLDEEKKSKPSRLILIVFLIVLTAGGYYFWQGGQLDEYIAKAGLLKGEKAVKIEPEETPTVPADELFDEIDFLEEPPEGKEEAVTKVVPEKEKEPAIEAKPEKPKEPEVEVAPKAELPKAEKKAPVTEATLATDAVYTIQVGIFAVKRNAERIVKILQESGLKPSASKTVITTSRLKLFVGHYPFREVAMDAADNLINMGYKPKVQIMRGGVYSLDMGTFLSKDKAKPLIRRLEDKGIDFELLRKPAKVPAIVVFLKDISGGEDFEKAKRVLDKEKIKYLVKK